MIHLDTYRSPIGEILLAEADGNLIGLWFIGQKYFPETFSEETCRGETPLLRQVRDWLDRYFAGAQPEISELPLAPRGSEFRQAVWQLLTEIPYGETVTYGQIAAKLAARMEKTAMSAQAVGGAVGHNPISVIIPCHRVLGADGSLTGYAGGVERKTFLLTLERKQRFPGSPF